MISLKGKNIIITGASSGIGRQCAITLSKCGANCILIGRNVQRLEETLSKLNGENHLYYSVDVNNTDEVDSIISKSVSKLGKIFGFIHAAGIEITKPFKMHKISDYEIQIRTNAISAFEIMKTVSKKKNLSQEGASFIVISSVMGALGQPGLVGYCASKGMLSSGIKAIALELASKNIRVNTISPGYVTDTPMAKQFFNEIPDENQVELKAMHSLGWIASEDVANGCLFLLSDLSTKITGTNLLIDSGYSAK